MSNFNCASSSEDEWTVVPDQICPSRKSTPFHVIDKDVAQGYAVSDTEEVILSLREETRRLTEEWHRLNVENEWMAHEIKGARFMLSTMFETLGLDRKDVIKSAMSSNVREDVMCFQNLTKKLLHAVENGMIQKVEPSLMGNIKKQEQGDVAKPMKTFTLGDVEQASISSEAKREAVDTDVTISVLGARLPRIEAFGEVQPEVRPRKTRRMVKRYYAEQRNTLKPAGLHHVHGITRKKRWNLNRGAPRQAFTAGRNC